MKKLILVLAIGFLYAGANAQTPVAATMDFSQRYNNTQAAWTQEGGFWVASFQENNNITYAFYKPDGTYTGTESGIAQNQLSAGAQDFLNTRFLGQGSQYTYIKAANRQEANGGNLQVAYLTMPNVGVLKLFFDANGQLSRREVINNNGN